jgi:hypothetical protein
MCCVDNMLAGIIAMDNGLWIRRFRKDFPNQLPPICHIQNNVRIKYFTMDQIESIWNPGVPMLKIPKLRLKIVISPRRAIPIYNPSASSKDWMPMITVSPPEDKRNK